MSDKVMNAEELLSWLHMANSQGLNGLLQRLELTVHGKVFLTDPTLELLTAENFEAASGFEKELTSTLRQAYFNKNYLEADGVKTLHLDSASHILKVHVYDLVLGKKILGHLITQVNEEKENSSHVTLIKQILPIILSEVIKLKEIRETEKKFQDNFVYDLLHK